jgi:predicted SprT family Zn-dependent metalloprotease
MKQLQLQLFAGRPGQTAATQPAAAPHAGAVLADELTRLLREPVEVQLTDNAWTMVSYKRLQGRVRFRLHHMFASAHEDVVRALAGFTGRNRRTHGRAIDAYIRDHRDLIRPPCDRPPPALEQRGRVHDLAAIFARLNAEQFGGRIDARIGWGRRSSLGRRSSMKMGVYLHEQKLIRIHPGLDHEQVPRYFVELVVFHEMLHQVVPPVTGRDGRRVVHGREFRAREKRFPGYDRARAWEKQNLHLLLRHRS